MKRSYPPKGEGTLKILFNSEISDSKDFQKIRFDEYTLIESKIKIITDLSGKSKAR